MNIMSTVKSQAIADNLIKEIAATAINPRSSGRKMYTTLLAEGYHDEAFQLFDERLARVPWCVYRVVRAGKPEQVFVGTRDRAMHTFQTEARRAGKAIENGAGLCRFYPSCDEMVVVAPILASNRAEPVQRVAAPVPIRRPRRTRLVVQPRNILTYRH